MMILHENERLFKELTLRVAQKMNVKPQIVEKDYWVTYTVQTLFSSQISNKIVFKGGTALSKCYRAIRRFSEDIDIGLANYEGDARAARRRTMRQITKVVSQALPQMEMPETRKGEMIRTTCHAYQHVHAATALGQVKSYIKLEVTQMGSYEPCQMSTMRSYIADYLDDLGDHTTIQQYNLAAFPVRVLGLERTFAEKVSCLTQYAHAIDPYKALGDRVRHIFDLHELLKREEIKSYIQSDAFEEMLKKVREEERKNYRDNNLWLTVHPAKAIIFANPLDTLKKIPIVSKKGFSTMLFDSKMPTDQALARSLAQIGRRLNTIQWYTPEEEQGGWVHAMYRKMGIYLPYNGTYDAIIVAKSPAEMATESARNTLYVFPMDSTEQRLRKLIALAQRDGVPLQVDVSYSTAYPVQFKLMEELALEYRVTFN